MKKNGFNYICVGVLLTLIFVICSRIFFYPPLSDFWSLLYVFHHLDEFPKAFQGWQWIHFLNWDPNEHISFRPLFCIYYYGFYRLFGPNYIFLNILNFLLYCFSVIFLYKFSLNFTKRKKLAVVFIGIFAFLFSHFDIIAWSFHIHIIIGFCLFLVGFMSYIKFLKTNRLFSVFIVILCFLLGMLSYEPFFLWPFAVLFLQIIDIHGVKEKTNKNKYKIKRTTTAAIVITYILYVLFFFFTRSLGTYDNPIRNIMTMVRFKNFFIAIFLTLFNFGHNIVISILPFLVFPLKVSENIYMGGPIIDYVANGHNGIVYVGGSIVGIILISFFIYLYRKQKIKLMKVLGLLVFLVFTETYIIFYCRSHINAFEYGLTEFRYQYIPNAFAVLIIILLIDNFLPIIKGKNKLLYVLPALIFSFNIICTNEIIKIYDYQFFNLKKIICNIKSGIKDEEINENSKIYISNDITYYLPHLCWNIEMGEKFIEGTYEWMFSEEEVNYFANNEKDADLIIDKKDFSVISKFMKNDEKNAKIINLESCKTFVADGKDKKYINLGNYYIKEGLYDKAMEMFEKSIELNPDNIEVIAMRDEVVNKYRKQ